MSRSVGAKMIGILVSVTLLLGACTSSPKDSGSTTPGPAQTPPETKKGPVTITFAGFSGPELDAHKRLAPEFEKANGGTIKVNVEEIARTVYDTKMLSVLQGKTGAYDVFLMNLPRFILWSAGGFVEPLTPHFSDPKFDLKKYDLGDYPKNMLDLFTKDGKLYAVPQEASAIMLFYRKDLFQKYGVKEPGSEGFTWEEYLAAAQTIQTGLRKDGVTDVYGTVHSGKRSQHIGYEVLQTMWSHGVEFLTANYKPAFNTSEGTKAAALYLSQHLNLKITPPGVAGYEYPEILTAFQTGKAAMAIEWNAAAPTVLNKEKSPITAANTGFVPFPHSKEKGPNQARIWPSVHAVAVSADSKHKKEAFQYLAWFTSKEVARDYVSKGGGSSGRASLLNDSEIAKTNPQYPVLLKSFGLYKLPPMIPELQYIVVEQWAVAMNSAITGQVTVDAAVKQAATEIEDHLKKQGYK